MTRRRAFSGAVFEVVRCLADGKNPPCKHYEPDYVDWKCHGINVGHGCQKCTGYEPKVDRDGR